MESVLPRYGDRYGINNFLSMKRDPLEFLVSAHGQCGESVSMKCGPYRLVSISKPHHIRHVLKDRSEIYTKKTAGYKGMVGYLGNGLLTNPGGSEWRANSKLLRPLFWPKRIDNTDGIITYWVREYRKEISASALNNEPINFTSLFRRLTLSILCDIMFGLTEKTAINSISSDIDTCIHVAFAKLYDPFYWVKLSNISLEKRFQEARKRLREFSLVLLEHVPVKHAGTELGAYMQSILKGSGRSRTQCRDEVVTFLQAGHETSSTALNAIFYRVFSDRSLQVSLQQSIDQLPASKRYSLDNVDLVNQCIWESFRFDPSTWAFDRYAAQDDIICGEIPVEKGSFVVISPYVSHRLFSGFSDQENFNPQANFQYVGDLDRSEYIPFSVGPRICPGATMAHKEIRETLIGMLDGFDYVDANTDELRFKPSITLKLSGDLTCRPVIREASKKKNAITTKAVII